MKNRRRLQVALGRLALLFILGASGACTYGNRASLQGVGGPSDPEQIVIHAGAPPTRPFDVVGAVSAQSDGEDPTDVEEELKRQAAELGADVVWLKDLYFGTGQWSVALRGSGLALKYK